MMGKPEFVYAGVDVNGNVDGLHIGPLERAKAFMPDCDIYKIPYKGGVGYCGNSIDDILEAELCK